MPHRLWTMDLEGSLVADARYHAPSQLLLVSTCVRKEEPQRRTPSRVMVLTPYPHRCYAVRRDGSIAWAQRDINLVSEAPTGERFAGVRSSNACVLLDAAGRVEQTVAMDGSWNVVGWNEAMAPVIRLRQEGASDPTWLQVGPLSYAIVDDAVCALDAQAKEAFKKALPASVMRARCRTLTGNEARIPLGPWHLVIDRFNNRLVASNAFVPGWVMAVTLTGETQWATRVTDQCCNYACIVAGPNRIIHASSCGRLVTFLSGAGRVRSRWEPTQGRFLLGAQSDGSEGAWVTMDDRAVGLHGDGRLAWEVPEDALQHVTKTADTLFTVAKQRNDLWLSAYDLQ